MEFFAYTSLEQQMLLVVDCLVFSEWSTVLDSRPGEGWVS